MAKPAISFDVDPRSLQSLSQTIKQYAEFRKKDNVEVLHRAGRQIAYHAMTSTKQAAAAEIAAKLKQQIGNVAFTKTGRASKTRKAIYGATEYGKISMIIKLKHGLMFYKGFPHQADPQKYPPGVLDQMALIYVNRRISSARFISHGWKPAWEKFRSLYRGAVGDNASGWRKGKGKGSATAATPGDRAAISLTNSATTGDPKSQAALTQYGRPGLQAAVDYVRTDMLNWMALQIEKRTAAFNARR
jgi:hypothetical protein